MPETKSLSQEFGEFVKNKRMALGVSQREFAIKIYGDDRYRAYISAIENGKKDISVKTMEHFLTALNSWITFIE